MNNDSRMTIVLAICIPLILAVMVVLLIIATPLFKQIQQKTDNVTVILRENLTGIRVIRAYNQQKTEADKFDVANKDMKGIITKVGRTMSVANPAINIIFNLCFVGIYAFGFYLLEGMIFSMNIIETNDGSFC